MGGRELPFARSSHGTTPPLTHITLPEGQHTITVRNDESTYTTTVTISRDKPATIKHRFGS